MRNRKEPSVDSIRGGWPARQVNPVPRPGCTALASAEQPVLSVFPEMLMEAVLLRSNMERAWKQVRANRGAPGPDGISIDEFPEWLRPRWFAIREQLANGTYRPLPVRRVIIPKPDGGERQLGIPNVLDRLIQQAILQVLTPLFDPGFSDSSHGFRPERSAHGAAKQVQQTIRKGYRFVVDMDLSKFFDRVQHDVLMNRIARRVCDKRVLSLIGKYLRAGVMIDGILQPSTEGTPQGGPLTPPTKVQTFSISLAIEKKGEVDSVGDSDLIAFDFNVFDGRAEDFATCVPVGRIQAGGDL